MLATYFIPWNKYAVFHGRAGRQEFWTFIIINCVIAFLLYSFTAIMSAISAFANGEFSTPLCLVTLPNLATLVPTVSVAVRRLHDTGRSGWNLLLGLIPLVGMVILLLYFVQDSDAGLNAYDAAPQGVPASAPVNVQPVELPAGWVCPNGHLAPYGSSVCPDCGAKMDVASSV